MNTMDKKVAMCNQLNMDFEEANELFGEESLESMQMARVNGGFVVTSSAVAIAAAIISAITGVITCVYTINSEKDVDTSGPTVAPTSLESISQMAKEMWERGQGGTITIDSIVENKVYGITFQITIPTPTE